MRRRRQCSACGYRFTTYERSEYRALVVRKRAGGELSAARIGDMCLSGLGRIDQVAYLQFAAVYRQLGVEDVQAELDRLTPLTSDTPTPAKA